MQRRHFVRKVTDAVHSGGREGGRLGRTLTQVGDLGSWEWDTRPQRKREKMDQIEFESKGAASTPLLQGGKYYSNETSNITLVCIYITSLVHRTGG